MLTHSSGQAETNRSDSAKTDSSTLPSDGTYWPELDGLRTLAVGLVVLTHAWGYPEGFAGLNRFAAAGWIGVVLFFVLSGFLITGILYRTRTAPRYFQNFYARRSLRIFPAYALLLLTVMVVLPHFSTSPGL